MTKLNKPCATIAFCAALATFSSQAYQQESQQDLSALLTEAIEAVNAQTPIKLDAETRLDSAATARDLLIYNNTMINYDANQLDPVEFKKNLEEIVLGPLCDNPDIEIFKQLKVTMIYRYIGKDGKFITEISKDMSTCK